MTWQSTFFGDQVPVVRCSHHKEEMSDDIALGGTPRGNERTVFSDYGVSAYPTHFLIDHDGKVVWHSRGYEESAIEELRKDLEKLGMK